MKLHTRMIPVCVFVFCCMSLAPLAMAASYGGGSGTEADSYQIKTPEQMNAIGANPADWGMSFKLMADLDMAAFTGTAYTIIGNSTTPFSGTFNGNGHIIKNLTYSTTDAVDYVGVFGYVSGGTIRNLGVENVTLSTAGSWVGGLVGHMDGTVTGCFATGTISGSWAVGGLVGNNEGGSVEDCYAVVAVNSGGAFAGGLVGRYWVGDIARCYSTGAVNGASYVGGFVGWNNVGTFTACFWDMQASGQNSAVNYGPSDGVTGTTTEEMKTLSTFTSAGWDFAYDDGNVAVWRMPANDYPRLAWQFVFGGGNGTAADPYQIWTPQQMNAIGANSNTWDKHFKLMADLDMSLYTGTQYTIIGQWPTVFVGTFDGNGHIIFNLSIARPSEAEVGLFGRIGSGGQVMNLGLENITISGAINVGGLVGRNSGAINACYAAGFVSGQTMVGGLTGYNYGNLNSCYATGSVSATQNYVGGLIGRNVGATRACYSTSSVSNTNTTGGLMGLNTGSIFACFWDTQTSGQVGSYGGKGLTTEQMKTLSIYQDAGWADQGWVIQDGVDYPRLDWEDTGGVPIPAPQAIPLAGSGTAEDPYLISTAQEFALLNRNVTALDKQFQLTADLDLNGVAIDPIGDLGEFIGGLDGHHHTLSNLTMHSGKADTVALFKVIGSGGIVRDLRLENASITANYPFILAGLCGDNHGILQNCSVTITLANPEKWGAYFGGLCGRNYGAIRNCRTEGVISGGGSWIGSVGYGGLIGVNQGTIDGSSSTCTLNANSCEGVGGLVGLCTSGTITSCYATGSVSGKNSVGGLIGNNNGTIRSCYSMGVVSGSSTVGGLVGGNTSTITACFWDQQTSGMTDGVGNQDPDPAGAIGKTTAEMKTLVTFTAADWDFEDTWEMIEDLTYPVLRKYSSTDFNHDGRVDIADFAIFAGHWMEGV
jgi:hypothetical protein